MLRHGVDDAPRLFDAATEGHHDFQIRESHLFAHALQRRAFEREAIGIGRVGVARGTPEAQHRVLFLRLEISAADQARIFVGLEVGQANDHGLRIERRGDGAHAFGETLHEIIAMGCIAAGHRLIVSARSR